MIDVDAVYRQAKLLEQTFTYEKWRFFDPAPKQREFLSAGKTFAERLLRAGNGCGKTETAAYEAVCHLTGNYPDWWEGYRTTKPQTLWIGGESGLAVRDTAQEKLFGPPGDMEKLGTGLIPKAALIGHPAAGRSAPNAIESAMIKHATGGTSRLVFKTYSQERADWQGPTIDLMWYDEEPPADKLSEGLARLRGKGRSWFTFTPLLGMTEVVNRFEGEHTDRFMVTMGLRDCPWYTEEMISRMVEQYPINEREARVNGTPMMGEGNVFQVPLDDLLIDPIPFDRIPKDWVLLWGIDFGFTHPFAAVLMAWDRDTDTIYVLHEIRMKGALPVHHADAMKRIAGAVRVAWPHDGHQRDGASTGMPLADIYRGQGLKMMPSHATHPSGGFSTYAGVMGMHEFMRSGRFKVSRLCSKWCEEYRMYHYKDGQIVKINDDLMSATRIGWMDRRYATAVPIGPVQPTPHRKETSWIRPDVDNWP